MSFRQLTKEQALSLYESKFWEGMIEKLRYFNYVLIPYVCPGMFFIRRLKRH